MPNMELWDESEEQRKAEAKIGDADIAECLQRVTNMKSSGEAPGEKDTIVVVSSGKTRSMLKAKKAEG